MAFPSFEDLEVWKRACQSAVYVYESLDGTRDWGPRDQMQRAAVSVASNIAEGYERSDREFSRFLTIARGSSSELRTQAFIAEKVDVISRESRLQIVEETRQLNRMLFALAKSRTSPET